jgi:hypothetical protein
MSWNNVAGTGNCITAEEFCRRRCNGGSVAPDFGRRCNFVYECLIELLEDALENDNNNNNNCHNCCCRRC